MKRVATVWAGAVMTSLDFQNVNDLVRFGEPLNEIEVQHQSTQYSTPSISPDDLTVWIRPYLVGVWAPYTVILSQDRTGKY